MNKEENTVSGASKGDMVSALLQAKQGGIKLSGLQHQNDDPATKQHMGTVLLQLEAMGKANEAKGRISMLKSTLGGEYHAKLDAVKDQLEAAMENGKINPEGVFQALQALEAVAIEAKVNTQDADSPQARQQRMQQLWRDIDESNKKIRGLMETLDPYMTEEERKRVQQAREAYEAAPEGSKQKLEALETLSKAERQVAEDVKERNPEKVEVQEAVKEVIKEDDARKDVVSKLGSAMNAEKGDITEKNTQKASVALDSDAALAAESLGFEVTTPDSIASQKLPDVRPATERGV